MREIELSDSEKSALYFSFLELGPLALQREDAWLVLMSVRTSEVKKCRAGISQVIGAIVKLFVGALPDQPISLARSGMLLPNGLRLFAKYDMCLQDGAAHKYVWCCKGDSGTKLCMLCCNLVDMHMGVARVPIIPAEAPD